MYPLILLFLIILPLHLALHLLALLFLHLLLQILLPLLPLSLSGLHVRLIVAKQVCLEHIGGYLVGIVDLHLLRRLLV
jgi:hypothetical protein